MDNRSINLNLTRILSGYYFLEYRNSRFKVKYPDMDLKYEADYAADQEFHNNKFSGWYNKESIIDHLIFIEAWSKEEDLELLRLEKSIDNFKVKLYENHFNSVEVRKIKAKLDLSRDRQSKLYYKKHCCDHITIEGYCESVKNDFLLIHSIYDENNELYFKNKMNWKIFSEVSSLVGQKGISTEDFRAIARSAQWRQYWSSNKGNIFGVPAIEWTDEQKSLVLLTKMYDNAKESPDSPPEAVYEDDDMFDGWMIFQERKREKEKKKQDLEQKIGSKMSNASEIFIMAKDQKEASEIYDINDKESRNTIIERQNFIKGQQKDKEIKDTELPDVQRELIIKSMENQKSRGK